MVYKLNILYNGVLKDSLYFIDLEGPGSVEEYLYSFACQNWKNGTLPPLGKGVEFIIQSFFLEHPEYSRNLEHHEEDDTMIFSVVKFNKKQQQEYRVMENVALGGAKGGIRQLKQNFAGDMKLYAFHHNYMWVDGVDYFCYITYPKGESNG